MNKSATSMHAMKSLLTHPQSAAATPGCPENTSQHRTKSERAIKELLEK